jgi:hypothetical protein
MVYLLVTGEQQHSQITEERNMGTEQRYLCLPGVLCLPYLHRFEHLKLWYELLSQIRGTQLSTLRRNMGQESTSTVTFHLRKEHNPLP